MVNNIAKRIVPLCFLLLLLIGVGCSGDEFKYTTKHANFVFDTRLHGHSAALATALGNVGVFCSVSETLSGGQRSFRLSESLGYVLCPAQKVVTRIAYGKKILVLHARISKR